MNKTILSLSLLIGFYTCTAQAEQFRVVGVSDGDTINVLSKDNRLVKCRLYGIDAPESRQAWGQRSKQSLSDLVFKKTVNVEQVDRDQYGRSVCRIFVDGIDVNKTQLQRGMAWWYKRYSSDANYRQAENTAKQQGIGLWSEPNPVPPWEFRRDNKPKRP